MWGWSGRQHLGFAPQSQAQAKLEVKRWLLGCVRPVVTPAAALEQAGIRLYRAVEGELDDLLGKPVARDATRGLDHLARGAARLVRHGHAKHTDPDIDSYGCCRTKPGSIGL